MKSNVINMNNGVVKSGEFAYTRQSRVLKAYGKEYTIPVRTVAFAENLNNAAVEISKAVKAAEVVTAIKRGIALFIGEEEAERIYPAEKLEEVDVDEVLAFWQALNAEIRQAQEEMLSKYRPAPLRK